MNKRPPSQNWSVIAIRHAVAALERSIHDPAGETRTPGQHLRQLELATILHTDPKCLH